MTPPESGPPLSYRDAGVDIAAGDALVERIKPYARRTLRPEVLAGIGGFGGLVEIGKRYREPVLVAGTDGVGTKLMLATAMRRHDTVGIDLVAMSVNDILVQGAEPLFFLDYFACGKLDVDVAADVVKGIAAGCETAGCALIGGETAEMPGMYPEGEYDLAGFAVGVVEKSDIIDGRSIATGDAVIGIASSGPHSNGFSLIRRIVETSGADLATPFDGTTLGDALLAPTRIYVKPVLSLMHGVPVKGMAHITGGGLLENVPRMLPDGTAGAPFAVGVDAASDLRLAAASRPRGGRRDASRVQLRHRHDGGRRGCARRTRDQAPRRRRRARHAHRRDRVPPRGRAGDRGRVTSCDADLRASSRAMATPRITVLISGRGSNLAALLASMAAGTLGGAVTAVIANRADAAGLGIAAAHGVPTRVVAHRGYASRDDFDAALAAAIDESTPDLVVLAGFMRVLGAAFVRRYQGRMINIHPSLLPAYPGLHTHRRALADGVRLHGCTVHFVTPDVDIGPIIGQAAVPVHPDDDEATLAARVLAAEHVLLPEVVRWYVTGRLVMDGARVRVRDVGAGTGEVLFAPAVA